MITTLIILKIFIWGNMTLNSLKRIRLLNKLENGGDDEAPKRNWWFF